ncbi:glycerol-3-phosphate phosphatase-like [Chironomus tepperi]|uniref:glycerol-3-phosphate phosphatase-like n=1 Tax=Chironomus tepperi TaxID=113505 RepID=UPI00391F64AB
MEASKIPLNLSLYSKDQLSEFINQFDVIFCDCDGVLYYEGSVIDNSNQVINKFIENGKKVFFITNNSQALREEILERYQKLNFNVTIDNIFTSPYLTARYLSSLNFTKKAFVIGCKNVGKELDKFGIEHIGIGEDPMIGSLGEYVKGHYRLDPDVGAVIISLDSDFSFPKLLKAMNYLLKPEMLFLATNADDRVDYPGFVFPDTGPFLAALERGSYKKATVVGKSSSALAKLIELPEDKSKILMIGDRLNIDIAFGNDAGFKTLLVETGDHKMENVKEILRKIRNEGANDVEESFIPDFIISSIGKFNEIYDQ